MTAGIGLIKLLGWSVLVASRVALYARVSTLGQAQRELPIEGQLEALRSFAAQKGWGVVKEYVDAGVSAAGHLEKRLALHALIEDAKARLFDLVLLWKIDRLARNVGDGIALFGEILGAGVEVVSITEHGLDSSPSGELSRNLLLSFAAYFSRQHGENVRRGMAATFRRGGWQSATAPYGYRIERRNGLLHLVKHSLEASVVQRIFHLAQAGKSLPAIATALNDARVLTRHGGRWCLETLRHLLRSETYLGHRVGKLGRLEHIHEPLVGKGTWESVQALLTARRRLYVHPRMHHSSFLLSPWATCGLCGSRVRGVCHQARYYVCSKRARYGKKQCSLKPIRQEVFEGKVIRNLRIHLLNPQKLRALIEGPTRPASIDRVRLTLESLVKREKALLEELDRGSNPGQLTVDSLCHQVKLLEEKLSASGPPLSKPTPMGSLSELVRRYTRLINGAASPESMNQMLQRIVVYESGLEIRVSIATAPPTVGRIVC